MKNEHRKGEDAPSIEAEYNGRPSAARSGWFDDQTFEITAHPSLSGEGRIFPEPEPVGNGVSDVPDVSRKVYLDNRAEGEPKLEGSWLRAKLFWKTERWKKLLKV